MPNDHITISYDDLKGRKVEQRLSEQQAIHRNRLYAQLQYEQLPVATAPVRQKFLHSTLFWLTYMGLLGGLLAWMLGALVQFKPAEQQAADMIAGMQRLTRQQIAGIITDSQAKASLDLLRREGRHNSYFVAATDPQATPEQRAEAMRQIEHRSGLKKFLANVLSFGISGLMLALCLGVAEPLSERNYAAAARNGAVSAAVGLVGGIMVALFVDRLYKAAAGADGDATRQMLARAAAWGVLGLFLTIGSGLVMWNAKKLLIGLTGGMVGGAIGGLLFDPVEQWAGPQASRLIALIAIGLVAGLGTGWIENAAKTGWLNVTAGLIAGKKFILYRNPTYIGSSPDCQIYLFRDPKVGRRHAALHLVPGGVELEDLPLGTPTMVNGNAVSGRARLRAGDRITVGATSFVFQEKAKT